MVSIINKRFGINSHWPAKTLHVRDIPHRWWLIVWFWFELDEILMVTRRGACGIHVVRRSRHASWTWLNGSNFGSWIMHATKFIMYIYIVYEWKLPPSYFRIRIMRLSIIIIKFMGSWVLTEARVRDITYHHKLRKVN
jgi:hypothetical protein